MSKAFHVPADLADKPLSLTEVKAIVQGRGRIKTLQRRIDRMPGNRKRLEDEIKLLNDSELALLKQSAENA